MSRVVPLIRAAALMPVLRWLRENGRSVEEVLSAAGQNYLLSVEAHVPIPILGAAAVMSVLEAREGADIGMRMITESSVLELAIVNRAVLGAQTPREAFSRVVMVMPYHCTHEFFSVATVEDGLIVRDNLAVPLDQRTRHVVDQYILAILHEVCAMTGAQEPLLSRIEMAPHPDHGFAHLQPWFGDRVTPSRSHALQTRVASQVADRPFRKVARNRFSATSNPEAVPLRGDGSLSGSVRQVLPFMLEDGVPTLDGLVALTGMTRRTLQRRLADEGTSFSELFAEMRQQEALKLLKTGGSPIGEVSRQLGFSQQSALTRAMRRWTGEAPSKVRAGTAS